MNINNDLLQFYVYRKLIKKKDVPDILAECKKRKINVRDYLLAKEIITEASELEARADYYCMPSILSISISIDGMQ